MSQARRIPRNGARWSRPAFFFAAVVFFVACGEKKATEPAGTPPGAPTIGSATPGNGTATVTFTAPADTGTSAITQYTATCSATGATTRTATGAASPLLVSGLTNGTMYTCSVTATNADGTGSASGGAQVTPTSGPTVPTPPTIGAATRGNASATIAFTAPTSNGGSTITGYTASCTAAGATTTGTNSASPIVVSGLTNGTQYSCNVYATNGIGNSAASSNVSVTPATVPSAPTIGVATAGNGSASIAFTAPASNGGATITGYTATCSSLGQATRTGIGTASPISVTSLQGGVEYSCNVFATNIAGNSVASSDVKVTPTGTPGPPTVDSVAAGNTTASVAFTAPANNGGAEISGYTATCSNSGTAKTGAGTASPIVVTALTNGLVYLCSVQASNTNGLGAASNLVSVTPRGPPGVPTMGTATAGDGSISVSFTAPTSAGGSPITGYTATCSVVGGASFPVNGASSPIVVTGLTNGTTYGCSVTATNIAGTSSPSGTASAKPRTIPGAPTNLAATAGNASASFTFTAPVSNGGETISSYTVSCTDGSPAQPKTGSASASPVTVTSLTNGTPYTCSATATNVAGAGPASLTVSVTPSNAGLGTSTLCGYSWNQVNSAITNAGGTVYTSTVSYTCNATQRTMTSNQIPDHPASALTSGNPNKMGAQTVPGSVTFTLAPAVVGMTPKGNVVGWAINGVKFDPATAEICPTQSYCSPSGATYGGGTTWNVEAIGQTLFSTGVDGSNAHIQPPQTGGAYHYHGMPNGYLTYLNKGQRPTLIGFAVDGFPIYAKWGYTNTSDTTSSVIEMVSNYKLKTTIPTGRPDTAIIKYGTFTQDWEYNAGNGGHLDECNGRTSKTPEFPSGTYAYYITNTYPYIQRCVKGTAP